MPIAKMSAMPNSYRYTILCLDNYEDKCMKGRLYHPVCEEEVPFRSAIELLCKMESIFDEISYPMAAMETRRFKKTPKVSLTLMEQVDREKIQKERRGELGTFIIRVCFRQNASWQGTLQWLENGRELMFRSVLELLLMVDSAVDSGDSWEHMGEQEAGLK